MKATDDLAQRLTISCLSWAYVLQQHESSIEDYHI
jgi:hypothetical protein